jgi:tetratricopeptide (TPR) repeat protein
MRHAPASRAAFDEAIALIGSGNSGQAEAVCRAALERHPRDANLIALLGALLIKQRRHHEAGQCLREAIALAPTFAKPHEDLGYLLIQEKKPEEAIVALERATRLDPKLEGAWLSLGKALSMLGRGADADQAFERAFELAPLRRLMALGAEHQKEGRLEEAEQLYRRVLRQQPEHVDALRLLGQIAYKAGRITEAGRLLERAIAIAPDFTAAIIDLGRILKEQDRYEEAIGCFDRVLALEPDNAQAHYLRGSTLAPAALTYEAIEAFQTCLRLRPQHAGALLGLGHALKAVGRQREAIESYRQCLPLKPDNGETWWSLANLKTYRLSDADIAEMKARLDGGNLTAQSEVNFLFALAKAHEDRQDYEEAWRYYEAGNARQRMEVSYDPVQTESLNDRLIEVFSQDFLQARRGWGLRDDSPIFVLGLPRSGSTLIDQILASHSQVEGTSELPYLGQVTSSLSRNRADGINYPEAVRELEARHFESLGRDYIQCTRMHRRAGAPRFVDKMPNNFPSIGLLALILPDAKIIDARRHPLDACLSCYRQLFARGQAFTYDLTEIGEYYLQYLRLMDHWTGALPGRVLTVHYEEVVTDLPGQVRRMLDFCELPWEDACLRFFETERPIRTASSEQVRQPIYGTAVGFWRHYEGHLDELKTVLAPVLGRYRHVAPVY